MYASCKSCKKIFPAAPILLKKRDSLTAASFWRRYFSLMGCSKNYIMYWGVYEYYNTTTLPKSVHKFHKFSSILLGTLYK